MNWWNNRDNYFKVLHFFITINNLWLGLEPFYWTISAEVFVKCSYFLKPCSNYIFKILSNLYQRKNMTNWVFTPILHGLFVRRQIHWGRGVTPIPPLLVKIWNTQPKEMKLYPDLKYHWQFLTNEWLGDDVIENAEKWPNLIFKSILGGTKSILLGWFKT